MRKPTSKVVDPLAEIEDMLSSLCGAQSHEPNIADPEQDMMPRTNSPADTSTAGEVDTSPKRSTRSRGHPKRAQTPRESRSKGSQRLPPSSRIRKSQGKRSKQRPSQRNSSKGITPRDFDDDGAQYDQDHLGTSSDDRENRDFLDQMKRLAEEQLDVQKRKNDAINVKAINNMKSNTDECIQRMKQIAGKVSSDIIDRAAQIEAALPSKLNEQTTSALKTVRSEIDAFPILQSQAKTFEDQINKLVQQLQAQRKKNVEQHDAEEKEIYATAEAFCASGERLRSVLREIEKMLDIDQFTGK